MSILSAVLVLQMPLPDIPITIPKSVMRPAVTAGQREVVLGPKLQYNIVMEVRCETDTPAVIGAGRIAPPSNFDYSIGYVSWSVTDGELFNKPCRILKTEGTTKGEYVTKLKRYPYVCQNTTTYWILPDGKLLRQSVELIDPDSKRHAEAVFWSDHIEVSIADAKNSRSFTIFPNIDLSLLDAQFKPMIDAGKIVQAYKEYYKFDPFTQAFTKYKASVTGTFHGSWLATKFEGPHVEIEGPKDLETVYVSKEDDLIKVDLPQNTSIVMEYLPHDKDPFFKAFSGKQSG
jgi:hypothetical protein